MPAAPSDGESRRQKEAVIERTETIHEPDLGHLVILLLAGTLAGLRDRLDADGFPNAANLVAQLTENCDDYLAGVES